MIYGLYYFDIRRDEPDVSARWSDGTSTVLATARTRWRTAPPLQRIPLARAAVARCAPHHDGAT
jgi:hypothetical protein